MSKRLETTIESLKPVIRFHWEKSRLKKKTAAEGTEKAVYKPSLNRGETLGTDEVIDEPIRRAARSARSTSGGRSSSRVRISRFVPTVRLRSR